MRALEKLYHFSQKDLTRFTNIFAKRQAPDDAALVGKCDSLAASLGLDQGLETFLSVTKALRPLQQFEKRYHGVACDMGCVACDGSHGLRCGVRSPCDGAHGLRCGVRSPFVRACVRAYRWVNQRGAEATNGMFAQPP